nr:hypothetical protein [Pseudomonadota bacterium]
RLLDGVPLEHLILQNQLSELLRLTNEAYAIGIRAHIIDDMDIINYRQLKIAGVINLEILSNGSKQLDLLKQKFIGAVTNYRVQFITNVKLAKETGEMPLRPVFLLPCEIQIYADASCLAEVLFCCYISGFPTLRDHYNQFRKLQFAWKNFCTKIQVSVTKVAAHFEGPYRTNEVYDHYLDLKAWEFTLKTIPLFQHPDVAVSIQAAQTEIDLGIKKLVEVRLKKPFVIILQELDKLINSPSSIIKIDLNGVYQSQINVLEEMGLASLVNEEVLVRNLADESWELFTAKLSLLVNARTSYLKNQITIMNNLDATKTATWDLECQLVILQTDFTKEQSYFSAISRLYRILKILIPDHYQTALNELQSCQPIIAGHIKNHKDFQTKCIPEMSDYHNQIVVNLNESLNGKALDSAAIKMLRDKLYAILAIVTAQDFDPAILLFENNLKIIQSKLKAIIHARRLKIKTVESSFTKPWNDHIIRNNAAIINEEYIYATELLAVCDCFAMQAKSRKYKRFLEMISAQRSLMQLDPTSLEKAQKWADFIFFVLSNLSYSSDKINHEALSALEKAQSAFALDDISLRLHFYECLFRALHDSLPIPFFIDLQRLVLLLRTVTDAKNPARGARGWNLMWYLPNEIADIAYSLEEPTEIFRILKQCIDNETSVAIWVSTKLSSVCSAIGVKLKDSARSAKDIQNFYHITLTLYEQLKTRFEAPNVDEEYNSILDL